MNDKTCLGRDTDIFVFEEMSAGKEYKDLEGRMEYVGRYRNRSGNSQCACLGPRQRSRFERTISCRV